MPCILCTTGTTPATVQVTIPAIGNGTCDCSNLAGTYILTQTAPDSCYYDGTFSINMGSCGNVSFKITAYFFNFLGEMRRCIIQKVGGSGDDATWEYNGSAPMEWDCSGTLAMPFFLPGLGTDCDWGGITGDATWESLY